MKRIIKSILNIPIHYTIAISIVLMILATMMSKGDMSSSTILLIISIATIIALQSRFGSVVIKSLISMLAIAYLTSMYTNVVMIAHGSIIEPFLLTLASIAIFLSATYNSNKYNYAIRSRLLWSTLFAVILTSAKMTFIVTGFSLLVSEFIGINILVIYTALWLLWVNNSKKSRIVEPIVDKKETLDRFKIIYIENLLDAVNDEWIGASFEKDNNAYPYIYNEALKAEEDGLSLIIVSNFKTSRMYDVGEININKSRKVLYLYVEARDNLYIDDAVENFVEELNRGKRQHLV